MTSQYRQTDLFNLDLFRHGQESIVSGVGKTAHKNASNSAPILTPHIPRMGGGQKAGFFGSP